MCHKNTWTNEDTVKLAKYVAYCQPNELPPKETMQKLLLACVKELNKRNKLGMVE